MKEKEEKILDVAFGLFKQHGVQATTLKQVCAACNISVRELNVRYKSKKELTFAVVKCQLNKRVDNLLIRNTLTASAVKELAIFFRSVHETIADLGAEILEEIKRHHPVALDQLRQLVQYRLIPTLQRNMRRGLTEGFYRENIDPYQYAFTYFFLLRKVLEAESDWANTTRMISHLNDVFFHSALNTKGMRV